MRRILVLGIVLGLTSSVAAQDAKQRLEKSPRHHEWVVVKNGDRKVTCFVAFPEVKDKATEVLVIHENKGLTDWVRGVVDQPFPQKHLAHGGAIVTGRISDEN